MRVLTLARDLQRRKARERHGLFVAEGIRTVEELLRSALPVRGALISTQLGTTPRGAALRAMLATRAIPTEEVDEATFATAADTEQPQGVLAVAEAPTRSLSVIANTGRVRIVVLDALQDPGNAGTILRSASALGAAAVVVLPGTVDPWNAKVVRSAVGIQFTLPVIDCTVEALAEFLRASEMACWVAAADGVSVRQATVPQRLALVVGNEGAGVRAEVAALATTRVAIPMAPGAESLNAAIAASILLYAVGE